MREIEAFEVHYVSASILSKQEVKGNQLIAKKVIEKCKSKESGHWISLSIQII
jgi:hypothetical protein